MPTHVLLTLIVAEERRKSRRFDEDRRAYGHIRRFIERHAGGRAAEWDEDVPEEHDDGDGATVGLEGLLVGFDGAVGERRHRRQHQHHPRRSSDAVGLEIGGTRGGGGRGYPGGVRKRRPGGEEVVSVDAERPFPGVCAAATRTGGVGLGAATTVGRAVSGACDTAGPPRRWQRSSSAPRRAAAAAAFVAPDDLACIAGESTECLYSDVHRGSLDDRYRASRGVGGGRGGRGGGGGGDGSPPHDDDDDDSNSHSALKFSTGRERPGLLHNKPPPRSDPRRVRNSPVITGERKLASYDDEWVSGGANNSGPCYGEDSFATTTTAWRAPRADNTAVSPPRRRWRGLGNDDDADAQETEPESETRSSRSGVNFARGAFRAGLVGTDDCGAGGAMGAAWRSDGRLAGVVAAAAAGSRSESTAGRSFLSGGL